MTYCVGVLVEAGLAMIADTRTNAGIDNISMYKKLHVLADGPDRFIVCASAGSLSVTQAMLARLQEGAVHALTGERRTAANQPTMFRVASLVGELLAEATETVSQALPSSASLLLGGRIGSEPPCLYLVYQEGNFIECAPDSPFLQIGELKYGKPILDRALKWTSPLPEAIKIALLSFDATMRSNLSVGRPLDLLVMPTDMNKPIVRRRIEEDDAYYNGLSRDWSELLRHAAADIPDPPFMEDGAPPEIAPEPKPVADKTVPLHEPA